MPFIEAALDEGTEDEVCSEGRYDLIIRSAEQKVSKAGNQMITCIIDIEGEDYASIFHHLVFPDEATKAEDPNKHKLMLRGINRFLEVFNIDHTEKGFNDEDLQGATGNCLVKIESYEGNEQAKLSLPRSSA